MKPKKMRNKLFFDFLYVLSKTGYRKHIKNEAWATTIALCSIKLNLDAVKAERERRKRNK